MALVIEGEERIAAPLQKVWEALNDPEVLKATMRSREYLERGEGEGKTLLDCMKDGGQDGMQHFDGEIEKLIRQGTITLPTGLLYATNPGNLAVTLFDAPAENDDPVITA